MNEPVHQVNEDTLFKDVSQLIENTQQKVLRKISQAGVALYWHIGMRVNQDILLCERAEYGQGIIDNLADQLQKKYGSGYSRRSIYRCVQFAKLYADEQVVLSLSSHLKWSHFIGLLSIDDKLKREFYAEMCRIDRWSTRELGEKISSMLFERTAIAKKPQKVIEAELEKLRKTNVIKPDFIIQDPYVFKYLSGREMPNEKSFEDAIIDDIEEFLLSMGTGFTFQERQKVIEVDGEFYKIDLLMYNRKLRQLIAVELKRGKFKASHKGQIELYLRWLEKYEMQPGENPPLGIVLCTEKSAEHVELLQLEKSGIRVSQVITDLPPKKVFEERLHAAITRAREIYAANKLLHLDNEQDVED